MGHKNRNYTNYSKPVEVKEETVTPEVTPTPEPPAAPEVTEILGVVVDCEKLNVREEANAEADVVCTIPVGTEVMINEEESTDEFYKICTGAGVEGFCMKKFIDIDK